MQIELNEQEAQALLHLIDLAVKASGIQSASTALHFANKIKAASSNSKEHKPEVKTS